MLQPPINCQEVFSKLVLSIFLVLVIGMLVLMLRQQRLEASHELVAAYRKIDQTRQSLWGLQARATNRVEPGSLRLALAQQKFDVNPIVLARQEAVRSMGKAQLANRSGHRIGGE